MALKLDMSKAYDRVEWSFLEKMILHLGFSDSFVSIIMSCIKSVSNAVFSSTMQSKLNAKSF